VEVEVEEEAELPPTFDLASAIEIKWMSKSIGLLIIS
jgi:hypothetical protein